MRLPIKLGIGSGVAFVLIIIIGWVAFPKLLKGQIKSAVALKKGNDGRELYMKVPFPLNFKLYVFNVTNAVDVGEHGAKPILKEIGPFVYDEWKEKIYIEEDEDEDTLDYYVKNTFVFNKKLSGALTGNEMVTILHPLIAGLALAVEQQKPAALSLINKAIISIHGGPSHPFLTATVDQIFFSGFDIYCNVTDFAGKALCSQLKTEMPGLLEPEPGIYKFSLLGGKNGTQGDRIKVRRGIKNYKDVGAVVEVNGLKELSIWGSPECNQFHGTDTTIFPPFLSEKEGLVSYAADICRTLPAYFVENTNYDGIPVRKYSADFGDQTKPSEKCYCPSEDFCYKKGIHDLTKCVGAPMVASLPHFYNCDPSYLKDVEGLNPNEKDHGIIILFESITGSPLFAKKKMQFSLPLHPLAKIAAMKNVPEALVPMFWVEEGVALNSTWTGQLKSQLFSMLRIVQVIKYMVLLGSLGGMGAAAFLYYKNMKGATITTVHKSANQDKNVNEISMLGSNRNGLQGHVNRAMSNNEINDKY